MADQNVGVIEADKGQYKLNIPQSSIAKTDVVDIDFVIQTKSGERIILAGAALESTGPHPPTINFTDGAVTAATMFSSVSKVETLAVPIPAMASLSQYEAKKSEGRRSFVQDGKASSGEAQSTSAPAAQADVAPLATPAQSSIEKLLKQADNALNDSGGKTGQYNTPPNPVVAAHSPSSSSSSSSSGGAPETQPIPSAVSVYLGNVTGQTSSESGGVTTIYGSAGQSGSGPRVGTSTTAGMAPNDAAQIAAETITGTSGNDIIYVDGATYFNEAGPGNTATHFAKQFLVQATGQFHSMSTLVIKGVPAGYTILDATSAAAADGTNTWTMNSTPSAAATTGVPVTLVYTTGDHAAFTLDFVQTVEYGGQTTDVHKKITVEARDVSTADQLSVNDSGGSLEFILPSQGIPNSVSAGSGNDTIYGGTANDIINGEAGADTIYGYGSNDTINGGAGADTLNGGTGKNTLDYSTDATAHVIDLTNNANNHGGEAEGDVLSNFQVVWAGSGGDTITGNATTSTTLIGGAGNDTLIGGTAADSFDGGAGTDVVSYVNAAAGMTIDLRSAASASTTGDAAGDLYSNVETIIASTFDDTFIGGTASGSPAMDGGANVAGAGHGDWIDYGAVGKGVTVNLSGGTGGGAAQYDTIANIESVKGSAFDDTFTASSAINTFAGNGGTDVVKYSSSTNVTIDQTALGTHGGGDAASDVYSAISTIVATSGVDTFIGGTASGSATMSGGSGSDWIDYQYAASGATLALNANASTSTGSNAAANDAFTGIENVTGSANSDTFVVNASGYATLDGGAGLDLVDYSADATAHTVNLATHAASGGMAAGNVLYNIEAVIGGGGADTLSGNSAIASTLSGGAGNDTLKGGSAGDTIDGGAGSDTVDYSNAGSGVTLDLSTVGGATGGGAAGDVVTNMENVIGSDYADTFTASSAANSFSGGAGTDIVIYANAVTIDLTAAGTHGGGDALGDSFLGIESVIGSTGVDTFIGGTASGSATMLGNGGADWLDYEFGGSTAATVDLAAGTGAGAAANDHFSALQNVKGGSGNDLFYASSAANSFVGGGGTDVVSYAHSAALTIDLAGTNGSGDAAGDTFSAIATVIGSSGDDTFISANSAATMDGGSGSNWVEYTAASIASGVTVNLSSTIGIGSGGAAGDHMVNITNILGSTFDDTLTAAGAGGTLLGNDGNDTLIAGAGTDILNGGNGTDVVSYAGAAAVTVDQTAGDHGSGLALHDSYSNVETIIATSNADTLIGGTGAGSASMDGGSGSDWVDYEYLSGGQGATLNLAANTSSNAAANDHFTNVENIRGSDYADVLTASSTNSTLVGGLGDDTLTAANGGSTLIGGSGADSLIGGAGVDTADYSSDSTALTINLATNVNHGGTAESDFLSGIDIVTAGSGNDTLTGNATATTTLYGGSGNDTMVGGTQGDWLDGGGGINTVDYSAESANLTVNLSTNVNTGGNAAGDKLYNIQVVIGGSGDDTLTGNASTTTTLQGGGGNDTLIGGSGTDSFDGGTGSNWVSYSNAGSGITVNLASGATGGGAAGDSLSNIQNLIGSGYADTLTAMASGSTLLGGAGNDSLIGAAGNDTLDGGAGSDFMDGGGGVNVVTYASSSGITIDLANAGAHGSGDALGDSYANISTIAATGGIDTFIGGTASGSATMDGGASSDWLDYEYYTGGLGATVNLNNNALNGGAAANDKQVQVENIIGSGYNDTLTGSSTLASTLKGGGGNDIMAGGSAADSFDGGAGNDTVTYNASVLTVTIDQTAGVSGTRHWAGDAYGDLYSTVETLIASANADTFIGGTSAGSASMDGNSGADWIDYEYAASAATLTLNATSTTSSGSGSAANDIFTSIENVTGSASNDTFVVNAAGYVTINGGAGIDKVDYSNDATAHVVNLSTGTASGGYATGNLLSNIEAVIGGVGNDTLTGNTSIASTLVGGGGSDTLKGGSGADSLDGGTGTDTVDYSNALSGITVNLNVVGGSAGGGAAGDTVANIENIIGSGFADTLTAISTGSTMWGGSGNDIMNGGTGNDTMDGGAGADTFTGNGGTDVVFYSTAATIDQTTLGTHGAGDALSDKFTGIASIIGSTGNDTFIGGTASGSATMIGNSGTDWIDYEYAASGATVNLSSGTGTNAAANDKFSALQNVKGSTLSDTFTASSSANSFVGGGGTDV
ncbi:MAG: hypothetical protein HY055_10480, partial [Magnetospirillum sp.]|nr:hypothetical protein [Magnetospirillum sp.]